MSSPIDYDEVEIPTGKGPRSALVMVPNEPLVVGRDRLVALRRSLSRSPIDEACIREVRRRRGRIQILVFRGRSDDGSGSWGFAEALTLDEEGELGALMVHSMELTRRTLTSEGVFVHVHTDFTPRDAEIFKRGTARAIAETHAELARPALPAERASELNIDLWTLKHLSFYFALPLAKVLTDVLPDKLSLLERRMDTARELLQRLAETAKQP